MAGHLLLKSELGAARVRTIFPSAFRTEAARKIDARVAAVLEMTRLEAQARQLAGSLSYGGEKMLGVAMALMCAPSMLLLDEPGSGLSHDELDRLSEVLRRLRGQGMTLCVIDHRVGFLGALADRAIVLYHGSKIAEGTPSQVLSQRAVIEAYLGDAHVA